MTVREVLEVACGEVWITSGEDPGRDRIECRIHAFDTEAHEWLSEKVLDSPVHMMDAEDDAIRISLYWDK